MSGGPPIRILFMPEGSILAHVGRSLALAAEMDRGRFDVRFAASGEHAEWIRKASWPCRPVYTQPRELLLGRLHRGGSAFDQSELLKYVEDESRVFEEIAPDIVVGDFRASLGISAELAGIPYACVTNAVWTPYSAMRLDPPENWLPTRLLGKRLLRSLAPFLEPVVFRHYAGPFNRVRSAFGLGPVRDVRAAMCSSEMTLLCDAPEFFPSRDLPATHHYIGPIVWEPAGEAEEAAPPPMGDRPVVYLTMGSTGGPGRLRAVAGALAVAGFEVYCTTAGDPSGVLPQRCHAVGFAPGSRLCRLADVVVCHAGNGTIYQALTEGRPLVGVPEFHDQEFNAQRLEALELGVAVRPGPKLDERLVAAVREVVHNAGYRERAEAFSRTIRGYSGAKTGAALIAQFAQQGSAPAPR